jgi:cholesterol oxidase
MTQGSPSASRIIDTSGMPTTLESWYVPSLGVNLGMNASLGLAFDLKNRASFRYDGSRDRVNLLWPKNGNDDAIAAVRHVNDKIAAASGTIPGAWPVAPDCNASWTAHPLGGAVLGRATDAYGRVIGPKNLYVMDGAMIPGTTGAVNPSLTISALAERNIEAILKQDF